MLVGPHLGKIIDGIITGKHGRCYFFSEFLWAHFGLWNNNQLYQENWNCRSSILMFVNGVKQLWKSVDFLLANMKII